MKSINRFYVVFACTIAVLVYCFFNTNPYQNVFFISMACAGYIAAMAYLFDDRQAEKYNESEKKFIKWLDKY